MKKIVLLGLMILGINLSSKAQSALCLYNNTGCDAYFAVYAELVPGGLGCPIAPTGCFTYRIDFLIKAGDFRCFGDYDMAKAASINGAWTGGSIPPGLTCFQWVRAEMQMQCPPPSTIGGCGLAAGTCGTIPGGPGSMCSNTGAWYPTPGGVPGDITVEYNP